MYDCVGFFFTLLHFQFFLVMLFDQSIDLKVKQVDSFMSQENIF